MTERHVAVSSGVDLLIVGAGIQGATAAYEASRRGRSVLLVDRDDFGAGSSSNSMKVAHGGLRYLKSLDLLRSLESIHERRRLLRLAPGLIHPLRCEMDVTGRSAGYRALLRGGLWLNEGVSWHRNRGVPGSHHLPAARFPGWWDALIEDTERVIFAFLHSAAAVNPGGFALRNHAALERLEHRDGRVVGARIAGLGSIEARAVLSCVGATRPGEPAGLSMNLVVEGLGLARDGVARALPHPDEDRNVFVVPWRGRSIVGTWDRSYPHDPSAPLRFESAWVDECLAWLAPVHPELARLTRREVRFVHAGLLPWDSADAGHPSDRFRVERRPDGLVDVRGVKWTTAYGVSVRALDVAEASLPRRLSPTPAVEPLVDPRTLLARFLDEAPGRREPVLPGRTDLPCGAVRFAVEREWARDLADVLLRRTASAAAGHPGVPVVEAVSRLLQRHLDWSEALRRAQVEAFHESFHFAGNVPRG